MEEVTCKWGRVWELDSLKETQRDPGAIICPCDRTLMRWNGSRAWYVVNLKVPLPGDNENTKCRYE
jgi:hypothetical protein